MKKLIASVMALLALVLVGACSTDADVVSENLSVAADQYKKHFLGLSDNVSYFVEQLSEARADAYHYRVIFKPEVIVPYIDLETSVDNQP